MIQNKLHLITWTLIPKKGPLWAAPHQSMSSSIARRCRGSAGHAVPELQALTIAHLHVWHRSAAVANHAAPRQQVKAGGYFLTISHFFKGEGANCSLLYLTLARGYACGHHRLITEPFPLEPEPHQTDKGPETSWL